MIGSGQRHCEVHKAIPDIPKILGALAVAVAGGGVVVTRAVEFGVRASTRGNWRVWVCFKEGIGIGSPVGCVGRTTTVRLLAGEDEEPHHCEHVQMQHKQEENIEYLWQSQFDGLDELLHDAGAEEEDEGPEEATDAESVAKAEGALLVTVGAEAERDKHVQVGDHKHGYVEIKPLIM